MTHCYLSTGSNLGDRQGQLQRAKVALSQQLGALVAASSVYETSPWGLTDQPAFLNQVLVIATAVAPAVLLDICQQIETALGRERHEFWGRRTIDIDILAVDHHTEDSERLTLPHRWLAQRRFVLVPLCEVAPHWVHPVLGLTATQLLAQCTDEGVVQPCSFVGNLHKFCG